MEISKKEQQFYFRTRFMLITILLTLLPGVSINNGAGKYFVLFTAGIATFMWVTTSTSGLREMRKWRKFKLDP